jgi:hypothetical protein
VKHVALWNGIAWSALGLRMDIGDSVFALAVDGTNKLCATGTFHHIRKSGTCVVEALNGKLCDHCGMLVRRFRSFIKCQTIHLQPY